MRIADRIRDKLAETLRPERLEITDESHRHVGHVGAREGGESHFRVEIVSAAFEGMARVERQRRVYGLLAGEFADGLHALSLATLTPAEARKG
jgi:BolA family transcriptional regulator, general stress-responsive regulator